MTVRTRYFIITSVLLLTVGVGTGLVAYYVGLPEGLFARQDAREEWGLIPDDAGLVAYVDVQHVMTSEVRRHAKTRFPFEADGRKRLEEQTGINLERDVDSVMATVVPLRAERAPSLGVLVLVAGRFDEARIEELMRGAGGRVEEYQGARLIVSDREPDHGDRFSLAFVKPGLVALGSRTLLRRAVDLQNGGGQTVVSNEGLMTRVQALRSRDAWAVGRFDVLASQTSLPFNLASQLPPIHWVSAGADINSGIQGILQIETADEEAAMNLREVVRGFVALGRLQASSQPALKAFLDSVVLGGTDRTVSLAFDAPAQLLDAIPDRTAGTFQGRTGATRK